MLSLLSREEARRMIESTDRVPFTTRTITDVVEIMHMVDQAREDGYAVVVGEVILNEMTVAAAIIDNDSKPWGAVHVTASIASYGERGFIDKVLPALQETMTALNSRRCF
jgi:IclR family transcriptional regulator, pca regulon regulatory protein